MFQRFFCTALVVSLILSGFQIGTAVATDQKTTPIVYRIAFRQALNHRVEIEAKIPTSGEEAIELLMPVWTPGSYLVREYARNVESISAKNSDTGEAVVIEKSAKNRWRIETSGMREVTVTYVLYCRELTVRNNWVDKDYAFLTGAATFLTRVDLQSQRHVVKIDAAPDWPNIATSLAKVDGNIWEREASNFDELVDSPILIGDIDIQSFEAGGVTHHLATIGTDDLWDTKKAAEDVKRIVEVEQAFWKSVPYKEYWFLNLATETGGGLEHDNSTVLMTGRWAMRNRSKYVDWLGLVSHEFFHTWNVRRLRPKELINYDFENEQYTRELWIAEGTTSYYDDLLLARGGLATPKEYLERLSKVIAGVETTPGRHVQPLSDSSYDTWIKFYRPDENSHNSRVSYYTKGSLVAMLLDIEIRTATEDAKSLDDVMRALWDECLETGYKTEDVVRIASEISGKDLGPWIHQYVADTEELSYQPLLDWVGLEWKPTSDSADGSDKPVVNPAAYLGADISAQNGKVMVDKVIKDGPAYQSGLGVGDELLAFGGYRVLPENWKEQLTHYESGKRIDCLIARRGKIMTIELRIGEKPNETWTLQRVKEPTEIQEKRWKNWLGIEE